MASCEVTESSIQTTSQHESDLNNYFASASAALPSLSANNLNINNTGRKASVMHTCNVAAPTTRPAQLASNETRAYTRTTTSMAAFPLGGLNQFMMYVYLQHPQMSFHHQPSAMLVRRGRGKDLKQRNRRCGRCRDFKGEYPYECIGCGGQTSYQRATRT